ncbi:hypothetical protein WJX84_002863 [Apatococcus fuscideae]|uniref:VWFD domain-containing protein n=1 Tax=Apatococcus fuscideae TaxID=2026836 RepID=A0AAW1T4N1_9CHLO
MRGVVAAAILAVLLIARAEGQCLAPTQEALCGGSGGLLGLGATVVTCTATCDVTNQGTVRGEPHFVGFDGSHFDFQGTPNSHYSLLTDNEHSLNAQFVQRGSRLNEETGSWFDLPSLDDRATVVGAVGLRFKEDAAQVMRIPTGQITVELNGKILPVGSSEVTPNGLSVRYMNTTVADGSLWMHPGPFLLRTVILTTDRCQDCPAEGILGQTLAVLYGETPLDTAFDQSDVVEVWDSEEHDHIHHSAKLEDYLSKNYNVSGLLANHAANSNFDKGLEHAVFQEVAARRIQGRHY